MLAVRRAPYSLIVDSSNDSEKKNIVQPKTKPNVVNIIIVKVHELIALAEKGSKIDYFSAFIRRCKARAHTILSLFLFQSNFIRVPLPVVQEKTIAMRTRWRRWMDWVMNNLSKYMRSWADSCWIWLFVIQFLLSVCNSSLCFFLFALLDHNFLTGLRRIHACRLTTEWVVKADRREKEMERMK